jgi:hypothetical protein
MRKLCSEVVEYLRKHPILWLPYIAADLLAIFVWQLRRVAEKSIFRWFSSGHSALEGDIHATVAKASFAYAPIAIVSIVAVVSLFVAALVATAVIIDSIGREQRPDARMILAIPAARWRKILLFSLRFLITAGVFGGGTGGLAYYLLSRAHRQDLITSFWFLAAGTLVWVGFAGWLLVPAAIRLVGGATALVSVQTRKQGTILAVLATEAGDALGFFLPKLESSMLLNSRWESNVLSVFNSILANAPDALLFIGLSLLAADLPRKVDEKKDSTIRELLPVLMPMHFGKGEAPPE